MMKKLHLIFSFLCLILLTVSCKSDDTTNTSNDSKIIGKWEAYSWIDENGREKIDVVGYTGSLEFKTGGTLIFTENSQTKIMTYTIDDDILKTKLQNGDPFITYRILGIDNEELKLEFLDNRMYYKRIK